MKRLLSVVLAFLLVLGSASPALAANAEAVTMGVELVAGSVTIKDAGGVALDYFDGIQLYSGCSVETGDDSCAYISLDEEKAIKLAMNTAVTIRKSGHKLQVMLKAGEIAFNVTKPLAANENLEIRTSNLITSVRGSSGGVNAETGEVFYGTGHGIVWFRETDQTSSLYGLSQRAELWGGRIVSVNWPAKDMELSDFSALFLGEVAENPDLQDSLKMEGRFDPQDMINLLPLILEAEIAAREEAKIIAVPLPENATDSPVNGDNVNPAFNKNWDLPTIVTPPPIIDLDDFIIPDDPMNPDEPEPTAYTVTWQDEDGTILETDKNVPVGTVPEFNGSDPIKAADAQYTYSFAGWDSIPAAVTGNAVYTATYKATPKTYTVTWKVDDETTPVKYDYGSVIEPPDDPAKTGCTFAGWDAAVPETMPAKDLTFTAQWNVNVNVKTYTVTWKVDDETTTVEYDYGSIIEPPADPVKTGCTFAGWDAAVPETMPAENLTFTAVWTISKYSVTFVDEDGVTILLPAAEYEYGTLADEIEKPEDPAKEEDDDCIYSFAGWDPAPVQVTDTATYKATYTATDKLSLNLSLTEGVQVTILTDTQEDGDFSGEGVTFTSESEKLTMKVAPGTWVEVHCETDEEHTFLGDDALLIDGVPKDNGEAFQVTEDVEISAKAYYVVDDLESLINGPDMDSVLESDLTIGSAVAASLNHNLNIMSGATLDINNEDAILTVAEGVTLTIDGSLTNQGTIINKGTIIKNGTISNDGQLLNCGTLVSDAGGSKIENTGVFLPKASNDNASGFTYAGEFENAVTGDGTVAEYGGLCNDDGSDVIWYLTDAETEGEYVLHITGAGAIQDYEYTVNGGSGGTAEYIVDSPWWDMKDNITELDLGDQITGIGAFAFAHSNITSLTVPASVKYLGSHSFYKSPVLSDLVLGSGVTEIRDSAFSDCDSLTTLVVPDNVTSIGASAFYGAELQTVEIGSGVIDIGYHAFAYCTNMMELTLSEGLVSICDHAFFNCWKLTSVSIPSSVQNIDDEAFCECNSLDKANFAGDPPTLGADVFKNAPETFCIYYPKNNNNWEIDSEGEWNGYPAESY